MELSAELKPAEGGGIIATNPETGISVEAETIGEALAKLREATERFLEQGADHESQS